MKRLFVDTAGWMAMADSKDPLHKKSLHCRDQWLEDGAILVISDYIIDETLTLVRRRLGVDAAKKLWRIISDSPRCKKEWITPERLDKACVLSAAGERSKMDLNDLSSQIIKAAINVHNILGPGLFESVYQKCMAIELDLFGFKYKAEVPLPVIYRDKIITDEGFRIDLLVEDTIVVELKSVEMVKAVYKKQLLTYLRLSSKALGLLINFNEPLLKDGITRIVNQKKTNASRRAAEIAEKDMCRWASPKKRIN